MAEIVEFDIVHEYSLYEIGITVDATLQNGEYSVDVDAKSTQARLTAFSKDTTANASTSISKTAI